MSTPQLAEQYRVSKSALLELLHEEGLAKRTKLTPDQLAEAQELRAQDLTYQAMGERFGVYGSTVWRGLRR